MESSYTKSNGIILSTHLNIQAGKFDMFIIGDKSFKIVRTIDNKYNALCFVYKNPLYPGNGTLKSNSRPPIELGKYTMTEMEGTKDQVGESYTFVYDRSQNTTN